MTPIHSAVFPQTGLTENQITEAAEYLTRTAATLADSTDGLSAEQWAFKPSAEEWSIAEIVEHLVMVEGRVHAILGKMSDAPAPPPDWDQSQTDRFVFTALLDRSTKFKAPAPVCPTQGPTPGWIGLDTMSQFTDRRRRTMELLRSPFLRGRVVPHILFGPWDGYQWLVAAGAHSARHIQQIREVKAHPDFPTRAMLFPD